MIDPHRVLETLVGVRRETLERLSPLSQAQLNWRLAARGGEEEWSLGEVFLHLAMDELYLRELIARPLLEGVQPPEGVRFLPPQPPAGYSKEVTSFSFDRGRAEPRRLLKHWPSGADLETAYEGGLLP